MEAPKGFDFNEWSYSNNSIIRLYDVLSVIEFSLELIKQYGRHEFQPVIMQQLRMIYTKGNDYYEKDTHKRRGLNKEENSFALFDIIGNLVFKDINNNEILLRDLKIFPEITLKRRNYEDLLKSQRFYYFTQDSIVQREKYTFQEFLEQDLVEVKDADDNRSFKNVEQCIKLLANKSQGAHYQVYIKKWQLDVIGELDIVSQTLGEVTVEIIMRLVRDLMLREDQELGDAGNSEYMKRETFVSFSVHSATPIYDEK
ncbi:hypothetical protein J4760_03975 [Salinicoccus sp. ID82-1]|uniref:hypothetical protein n=1 Tax=Salinicoccus sp. ID82-1 TaxID=2820269 RepID=UPI001F37C14F|nr:hypothetical protein [Salinicoccus sp. ID82-1]MCG1009209.1 hypothetical protein [Salinicoccus sp. ID82-1]